MRTLSCTQGTAAWHAERAGRFTASEAPAMMGASKFLTRAELLKQKHSGLVPEVSAAQQALYDRGHAAEAAARTLLEDDLGDLFPVTALHDTDDRLLASMDGITLDDSTVFEHKLYSDSLAAQVRSGIVDMHYVWQLEHQLLVSGAERVVFVCSDGTRERWAQMEYRPVKGRREQLLAGWEQFASDLACYVAAEATAQATVAAPVEALPAVSVRMDGALAVHSNLDVFGAKLREFIAKIPAKPTSDQEFVDCDAACKALKKAEDALDGAEANALGQVQSVETLTRTIADLRTVARAARLAAEKMVKARKEAIRLEEVQRGQRLLAEFITGLNETIGRAYMPPILNDFAGAISGKKTLESLRAAVDQHLADKKIEANAIAGRITINLRTLRELAAGYEGLFPDTAALVLKLEDDCRAVIGSRIAAHKEAEERRAAELAERERTRIRAEEEAKLRREQEERDRQAAQAAAPAPTPAPALVAPPAVSLQAPAPSVVVPMQRVPIQAGAPATLTLGGICDRLGFNVTAAFLHSLGVDPAATDKAAKLYREDQFQQLCEALVAHVRTVQSKHDHRQAA